MDYTATLSRRESEVAELIAWGATKKEIAQKLYISERTVENHARSIYQKANVTKSNELAAWWFCRTYNIPKKVIIVVIIMAIAGILFFNQAIINDITAYLK